MAVPPKPKVKFTIYIDKALNDRLKEAAIEALRSGETPNAQLPAAFLVRTAIREFLDRSPEDRVRSLRRAVKSGAKRGRPAGSRPGP